MAFGTNDPASWRQSGRVRQGRFEAVWASVKSFMRKRLCPALTSSATSQWIAVLAYVLPSASLLALLHLVRNGFAMTWHAPEFVTHCMPIPLALALWTKNWLQTVDLRRWPPALEAVVAHAAVAVAALAAAYPPWRDMREVAAVAALLAAYLAITGCARPLNAVRRDPAMFAFAVLLGGVLIFHHFLYERMWEALCTVTAYSVAALTSVLGIWSSLSVIENSGIHFHSSWFGVRVFAPCSGMDGLGVFTALYATVVLADWEHFRKLPAIRIYVAGLLTMLLGNVARLLALFLLGHISSHPFSRDWAYPLRDGVFAMFHDHVGWVFYLIIFGGFMHYVYQAYRVDGRE